MKDSYNDHVEGVYTYEAKLDKEREFLEQASQSRDRSIEHLNEQIAEITEVRNPIIYEAEALLSEEAAAKEANHTGRLKEVRKKRKVLLKQAERLTNDIHRAERQIMELSCLTKSQLIHRYGDGHYFEEHWVVGTYD
jgi:chromosome segregation ATPase